MCKIIGVPVINSSSGEMALYFASMPDFMIILFFGALCKVAHVLVNEGIFWAHIFSNMNICAQVKPGHFMCRNVSKNDIRKIL